NANHETLRQRGFPPPLARVYPARAIAEGLVGQCFERRTGLERRGLTFTKTEETMNRTLSILAAGACALASLAAPAQAATEMSLTRIECGTPQAPTAVNQRFSDTYAYGDLKLQ